MALDGHNNQRMVRAISPVAIGTTGTGKTSNYIDRAGYAGVELYFSYGQVTATNALFTATVFEGDTTGGAYTSVADADLLGSELAAGLPMANPRTSGVNRNTVNRLGYIGIKRYLKVKVASTVTAGTPVSVDVLLHTPRHAPVP